MKVLDWTPCSSSSLDYQSRMFEVAIYREGGADGMDPVDHRILFDYATGRHWDCCAAEETVRWYATAGHKVRVSDV